MAVGTERDASTDSHTSVSVAESPTKEMTDVGRKLRHVCAGAIAGAVSRTCVSPLERLKILLQVQVRDPKFSGGVLSCLIKIKRDEGFRGFFKGNGTNVLRIIPYAAVQFAAYEEFKKLLRIPENLQEQTPGRRLLAGAMAGVTSVTATYPLDLVRTRLATQMDGTNRKYKNIVHAFRTILQEEGKFSSGSLYRGWVPTVMGIAPYVGLNFAIYETLKGFVSSHLVANARANKLQRLDKDKELPVMVRLTCGGLAGAMSQSVTYPLDVVRRRMQMKGISGALFNYSSTWNAFSTIVQVEGPRGLYKGMWPNLLKVAPLVGIQFVTYEIAKKVLYGQMSAPWS